MAVIGTNIAANTAVRFLNKNNRAMAESSSRLASGKRIVKASDDAAGLAVATKLASDITVLKQASTNTQQGASVLAVADGAMANLGEILQRAKALAAQSLNGAVDNTARGYIDDEYQQLLLEANAIVSQTKFNGTVLLNGSYTQGFLVGTAATDLITVTLGTNLTGLIAGAVDTVAGATTAVGALDTAIGTLSGVRALTGAYMSQFKYHQDVIDTAVENLQAANSAIMDTDIAAEQTNFTNQQVLTQTAIAVLKQANQMQSAMVSLVQ